MSKTVKKRRRKTKRKKTNTSSGNITGSIVKFFRSERARFIFGVLIAFAGIFLMLAVVSFFFTGAADQSKVLNKSLWELINDKNLEVANWTGAGGAYISEKIVNGWFGIFSILIPLFIVFIGLKLMDVIHFGFFKGLFITAFGLIGGSIAGAFILGKLFPESHINWGGVHGNQIEQILENTIGWPGMVLLMLLFAIVAAVLIRRNSMYKIQDTIINTKPKFSTREPDIPEEEEEEDDKDEILPPKEKINIWNRIKTVFPKRQQQEVAEKPDWTEEVKPETVAKELLKKPATTETPAHSHTKTVKDHFEIVVPKGDESIVFPQSQHEQTVGKSTENNAENPENPDEQVEILEDYDPKKDLSNFKFPEMSLLKVYNAANREIDMAEQNENKDKIINTLRNYGIEITSIKATVGPTITLYEIVPEAGVRISKIRNLEDDIALSLSALGIRIIAPMPGKGTIGIEVPNKDPQIVSMQSVIASKKFQECDFELPVALGKTITNEVFIFDLTKMPHLLVAGATGQGKSVGLNAIITSLLYKKHPSEMKMVLVDPKMVEFNIYSTIEKHYLAKLPNEEKAIITDVTKVTQTLNSLTKEMDDRYELLMRAHVRTIREYNEKFIKRRLNPNNGHRYLPYMVVIIDEFGDLIMTAGKEIEMPIARIAQKARAVGMHMVIATQRPTTNIITGTIKANFPARMAFRVTSQIDSRTILDQTGANQLIGRGDMLFSQGSNLIRIQCAFVDTPEVEEIAQYIGNQRGYETAFALPEVVTEGMEDKDGSIDLNERDSLFEEAARLIVIHQQGSTSLIQRKFSIGYNRAGRLMDQLEAAGIVGPTQGSKPRDVYISDEYSLEKMLDALK